MNSEILNALESLNTVNDNSIINGTDYCFNMSFSDLSTYDVYNPIETDKQLAANEHLSPPYTMDQGSGNINNLKGVALILKTLDNTNFRLYLCAETILISPYYQNKFCKLLNTLNKNQTLTIYVGNYLDRTNTRVELGCMISAMNACSARITTYAVGRCGFSETVLWMYGHERKISPFGMIQLCGASEYLNAFGMYEHYFKNIYTKAKELNLIDEEQINELMTTGKSIVITPIMYNELNK